MVFKTVMALRRHKIKEHCDEKKATYELNKDKAVEKMIANVERGEFRVEDTPKHGAKLVFFNPGEFKVVMDQLESLQPKQKFTLGNVNVNITENTKTEEKAGIKVSQKLVLRLTRRTFPTSTTSSTVHVYPTEQKVMIQGSRAAQDMCEKEFVVPLVKKLLAGKNNEVEMVNKAVANTEKTLKRKKEPFPCDYCERKLTSTPPVKTMSRASGP